MYSRTPCKIDKKPGLFEFEYINIQEKVSISPRIHTDIFESIVGAIFLDSDYKNVSIFLKRMSILCISLPFFNGVISFSYNTYP